MKPDDVLVVALSLTKSEAAQSDELRQLVLLGREAAELMWEMAALQDHGDAAAEMAVKSVELQVKFRRGTSLMPLQVFHERRGWESGRTPPSSPFALVHMPVFHQRVPLPPRTICRCTLARSFMKRAPLPPPSVCWSCIGTHGLPRFLHVWLSQHIILLQQMGDVRSATRTSISVSCSN